MSRPDEPPPWWPEDEAWPPADGRMARRQFVPRIAALMLGLILLFLTSCLLVFALYWSVWRRRRQDAEGRRGPWFFFPVGGLLLLLLLAYVGTRGFRSLRTNALALDGIVRGVDRIAAGDYDVRLVEQGWPETRDLSRSVMTMAARLRDAEAKRIALQADIAHELRSPLTVIQGTTEGMLDGVYPRDDAHLDLIMRRSRMMAGLLDDFRTIATAEAGALQLHLERIDVSELLDEIAADVRDDADRKGIVLDRAGASALNVEVDPTRLTEVVENLLKNALRHTSAGDRIELGAATRPNELVLWVRDTGEGISPDQLPHIFERYAKSVDSGGSGLGLAIARRLVEAHGGTIEAESAEGQGTTFTVRLPQLQQSAGVEMPPSAS